MNRGPTTNPPANLADFPSFSFLGTRAGEHGIIVGRGAAHALATCV